MQFRELLNADTAYLAPAVFNPLSAKLAEQAGFKMLYSCFPTRVARTPGPA